MITSASILQIVRMTEDEKMSPPNFPLRKSLTLAVPEINKLKYVVRRSDCQLFIKETTIFELVTISCGKRRENVVHSFLVSTLAAVVYTSQRICPYSSRLIIVPGVLTTVPKNLILKFFICGRHNVYSFEICRQEHTPRNPLN
jgi:hypothetical protein